MENDALNVADFFADDSTESTVEAPQSNQELEALKQEIETLRSEKDSLKQWQDNAAKFFGGQTGNSDPNEQWAQTLMDPSKLTNVISSVVNQQTAKQQLEQEYASKYPDLVPFKEYILGDAAMIAQRDAAQGKYNPDQHYIDLAIKDFQSKLQTTNGQGRRLTEQALSMDTGRSSVDTSRKTDFDSMSDEQFEAYSRKLNAKAWQ